ncbi:MAG: hypothetical protein NTV73_09460 [Hyphomicrobiales bacterium]|nr:hypothetical protein [Hyphomicrobiales bacterium]
MKIFRALFRLAALGLVSAGLLGVEVAPSAAADCYAIGQQVAADNGGQLANVSQTSKGGQPACVIVVLIPGKDGSRPRREEFVVPAN